jgi:hypothetical protein
MEEQFKMVRNRNLSKIKKLPAATISDNDRARHVRFCQYVVDMVTKKEGSAKELAPDGKPWNIYINRRLHDEFGCPDNEPCQQPGCKDRA